MYNCTYLLDNFLSPLQYVCLAAALFAIFVLSFFKKIHTGVLSTVGLLLLTLGGGYNLFERGYTGCVFDNIDLMLFYVNLADLTLTLGLILILLDYILSLRGGGVDAGRKKEDTFVS
jgi:lipoprotein signal peptidase